MSSFSLGISDPLCLFLSFLFPGKFLYEYLDPTVYVVLEDYNEGRIGPKQFIGEFKKLIEIAREISENLRTEFHLTPFEEYVKGQTQVTIEQCEEVIKMIQE